MAAATDNMRIALKFMQQLAVYWAPLEPDQFGSPTWDTPVEVACRWEDIQEEFITPTGDREMSFAELMVDRDMEIKGVMLQGELDSTVDQDNPKDNVGAFEIRQWSKLPDRKGTKFLREVIL